MSHTNGQCRYKRVYNAAIKDRAFTYAWFFLFFLIHIAFCIWAAVSPPLIYKEDWGHAGFITGISAFNNSNGKTSIFVGVCYMVGGGLWSLEALWSVWVLKVVSASTPFGTEHSRLSRAPLSATALTCGCLLSPAHNPFLRHQNRASIPRHCTMAGLAATWKGRANVMTQE